MNDQEEFRIEGNGFTNADNLQLLRTFAEFILEFLNLISDIILLAFGMKGRFMSRFSCCSKCVSADDMSESDIEFSNISDSMRDLSSHAYESTSSTCGQQYAREESVAAEDLVSVSSLETSRFVSCNTRIKRYRFKSRIPRLIPICGNVSESDTEDAPPSSINDRDSMHRLSNKAPLDFIHEFNSFVRKHNRQLLKTHLKNWFKAFSYFVYINDLKEQRKCLSAKEKMILNAIREKRDELVAKMYEIHEHKDENKPMTFNMFHKGLIYQSRKYVHKMLAESTGDSGDSTRNAIKDFEEHENTDVSTADEVYPTIEKQTENKLVDIGGGEIMQIVTKQYSTAKKKPPGVQSVPDYGKYPQIYPLPISSDDFICRTVKTKYRVGTDSDSLMTMYMEEHECSPSPYNCITCQKNSERGHLTAKEVKGLMFRNCHSVLQKKVKKSDLRVQTQVVQQSTDEIQSTRAVDESAQTPSRTRATASPLKGGRCCSQDARIVKGLAQPRNKKTVQEKTENVAPRDENDDKNVIVNPFGKTIKVERTMDSPSDAVIEQQEDLTSVSPTVESGIRNKHSRRIASARRRLKSVPPSIERCKTRTADPNIYTSQTGTMQNRHNPNDALSIDGPTNDVLRNIQAVNIIDCLKVHIPNDQTVQPHDSQGQKADSQAAEIAEENPAPLHFIDTDNELLITEPKEPVYQDIDATVDLSRNTVEPRYGDRPNKKKLQAEMQIREKIKTKGEANKHLKTKQKYADESVGEEYISFDDSYGGGDSILEDSIGNTSKMNDETEETNEEEEEKPAEPVVVNAVEQPQTMDDREFKMVPEEILRKDNDRLKDLEEMYAVSEKRDKKKKREKKNNKKKLTIPLNY